MSQEGSNEKKKKMSFEKKLIIVVSIIVILIIGVTFGLIVSSKNKKQDIVSSILNKENDEDTTIEQKKLKKGSKLTDTYSTNAIKTEEKDYIIQRGNISDEMKYIQIDGLKDENIEKNINDRLYTIVVDGYNKILEKGKKKYKEEKFKTMKVEGYSYVAFRSANILSVHIVMDIYKPNGDFGIDEEYALNISLVTGEDITFNDLFASDANIISIVEQSIYENLAWTYQDSEFGSDMSKINYGSIEDKVFLYVQKFKELIKKDRFSFYITSRYIYVVDFYNEKNYITSLEIDMTKFVDFISVYNLCSEKKDIYDGNYPKTEGLFIFEDDSVNCNYFKAENEENYFLRLWLNSIFEDGDKNKEQADKLIERYKKDIPQTMNKLKKQMGKDKALVIATNVQVMYDDTENVIEIQEYYDMYSVKKDFYKNTFYDLVREACQINKTEGQGIYIDYYEKYEKQVKNKTVSVIKKYDVKTLKLISEDTSDSEEEDNKTENTEDNSNNTAKEENTINNNEVNTNTVENVIENNIVIDNNTNTVPEAIENKIENIQN